MMLHLDSQCGLDGSGWHVAWGMLMHWLLTYRYFTSPVQRIYHSSFKRTADSIIAHQLLDLSRNQCAKLWLQLRKIHICSYIYLYLIYIYLPLFLDTCWGAALLFRGDFPMNQWQFSLSSGHLKISLPPYCLWTPLTTWQWWWLYAYMCVCPVCACVCVFRCVRLCVCVTPMRNTVATLSLAIQHFHQ